MGSSGTAAHTFRFTHQMLPLPSTAQSWLIARGCHEDKMLLADGMGANPANHSRALAKHPNGGCASWSLVARPTGGWWPGGTWNATDRETRHHHRCRPPGGLARMRVSW
ncbi:hypothetical protein CP981_34425 [Streptomyces platensis]|uniref:Uncharacterized protein n=1 Tax=Streptomyces platensis TaxID=58346 RepID=A0AAE6TQU1_STRPT|nr:hypothetical protein [Streptomyces platensis]OSY48345.1 hypothetical protein BG653_00222 [Streptomyces platensis]QEV56025.1 hypothetical protein CP981_34425 [Streptomyces platensis]